MQQVFVYGTLRPHCEGIEPRFTWNFERVRHGVISQEPATTLGTLHAFSRFPAITAGVTVIQGNLLCVTDETLQTMDQIEGHPNFYCRQLATVQTATGEQQAWIYWGPESCKNQPVIETGDWFFPA